MFSIVVIVIAIVAVVLDALIEKKRLKPEFAASIAEVNADAQVSESHDIVLPPLTPELVAAVAGVSAIQQDSSHGDLSSPSEPESICDDSLPSGQKYEVFLSFRGPDTRKTFTDCLYRALVNARVNTFRDDEELRTGEEIGPNLLKAIAESRVYIPIFSKNYASSKWCLKELTFMLKCTKDIGKHVILPVFFDVSPAEVQGHTEYYRSALQKHEVKYGSKTVQQWKEALSAVSRLKGMGLVDSANGYQGQLIDLVVSDVLSKLKKAQLSVPEKFVGIDDHVKAFKQFHLKLGETDAMVLGIYGMGGIGKTTLAKVIYNDILDDFDCCSFIEKIRETSQSKGHHSNNYLMSSLYSDLSRYAWSSFEQFRKGSKDLEGLYQGKKVLIFLDDVDDTKQLDALVIRRDSFAPGSRIIITTRDKEVLDNLKVKSIYEVKAMDQDHALKLFCKHAFNQDTPSDELNDLSNGIVRTTGGLPLALEAIGSLLSTKRNKGKWEAKWEQLKVTPHKEVLDSLEISYDSLTPAQQTIFLDIACFFIGEKKHTAFSMWKACGLFPEDGVHALVQKCLIEIRDDSTLWMHDQLRDFGRETVRKENYNVPGERSRLWLGKEAKHVLEYQMGSSIKVEAIRVDESCCFKTENFRNLLALRFLEVNGAILNGSCFENLLPALRWLRWTSSSFSSLTNLHQPNLVCLDLPYNVLTENWDTVKMVELKSLNLTSSLHLQTPFNYSAFPKLERLILSKCKGLEGIDPSLNKLENLTYLDISGCESIEKLPRRLGSLKKLEVLDMSSCKLLKQIPDAIIRMASLTDLVLDDTGIQELGSYVGQLKNLRRLSLRRCSALTELPDTIGRLFKLQTFDLRYCENLEILPALPGSQHGDEDANLIILNISGCRDMRILPSLSNLKLLKILDAKGCTKLKELVGLDHLSALESLDISHCHAIKKSPDFSNLKLLKELGISGYTELEELVGLDQLAALESLDISDCPAIKKLPDFSNFKLMKSVLAKGCSSLQKLDGLGELHALKKLHISLCKEIKKLPDISKLKQLEELDANGCGKLQELVGLGELKALERLTISGCKKMEKLPDLSKLNKLEKIYASDCVKLRELTGLDCLKELQILDMSGCKAFITFPDLSKLLKLEIFDYSGCEELKNWLESINHRKLRRVPYFKQMHGFPEEEQDCDDLSDTGDEVITDDEVILNSLEHTSCELNLRHHREDDLGCNKLPIEMQKVLQKS